MKQWNKAVFTSSENNELVHHTLICEEILLQTTNKWELPSLRRNFSKKSWHTWSFRDIINKNVMITSESMSGLLLCL